MRAAFIGTDVRVADLVTLAINLRWPGATPILATSGASALEKIFRESLDVVLLYPDLADRTMTEFIRDLRGFTHLPLLVLSDQDDETQVVAALEVGADDYVRLPCDPTEIMIRIWALVRRAEFHATAEESQRLIRSGPLLVDPATFEVFLSGKRLPLTTTEFRVLHFLIKNRGAVVAHQTMERALWSGRNDSSEIAKKYIQRLRNKLGDDARKPSWIASVHGVGYRFVGPQT